MFFMWQIVVAKQEMEEIKENTIKFDYKLESNFNFYDKNDPGQSTAALLLSLQETAIINAAICRFRHFLLPLSCEIFGKERKI